MTFHALATSPAALSPQAVLARLVRLTSKTSGMSSLLMLAQYSSPLVINVLLYLSSLRAKYHVGGGKSLATAAVGWGNVATSLSETRIILRLAGLLPIIQWLGSLHPNPAGSVTRALKTRSLVPLNPSGQIVPLIQAWSLAVYYPAEHVWWFSSKGVLGLSPEGTAKAGAWLMRGWAAYVVAEVYKIAKDYMALQRRSAKLRQTRRAVNVPAAEGYELQEKDGQDLEKGQRGVVDDAEVDKLQNDWENWALNAAQYVGYVPLTAHWCTVGGLGPMKNPNVAALLGTITGVASVLSQWKAAA